MDSKSITLDTFSYFNDNYILDEESKRRFLDHDYGLKLKSTVSRQNAVELVIILESKDLERLHTFITRTNINDVFPKVPVLKESEILSFLQQAIHIKKKDRKCLEWITEAVTHLEPTCPLHHYFGKHIVEQLLESIKDDKTLDAELFRRVSYSVLQQFE